MDNPIERLLNHNSVPYFRYHFQEKEEKKEKDKQMYFLCFIGEKGNDITWHQIHNTIQKICLVVKALQENQERFNSCTLDKDEAQA